MPVTITLKMLQCLKACSGILDRLKGRYGDSFTASDVEALAEAVRFSGNLDWCASNLLRNKDAYEAAIQPHWNVYWAARKLNWDAYKAAIKPHWDAYWAAKKLNWDAYEAARQPHWDAYIAAKKLNWDAYEAARQPHWDAYIAACSLEFARLYFLENVKCQ